jgi:hypothetical protein
VSVSKGRARPFSPAGLKRAEFKRLIEDVGSAVTLHATTDLEFGELESGLLGELKPSRLAEPESIRLPGVGHDEQNAVTVAAPHDDAGRPHVHVLRAEGLYLAAPRGPSEAVIAGAGSGRWR